MGKLDTKIALITGGTRGIGGAISRAFVAEGARVLITDILEEEGASLCAELGPATRFMKLDVREENAWRAAIDYCKAEFGGIDVLVNNAGILRFIGMDALTVADMRDIIEINLLGTMIGTQMVGAELVAQGRGGSIVNMSSADGMSGTNALMPYVSSKWGVRGMTKAAAMELGLHDIRVNSIHPGGIDTPMANMFNLEREQFDEAFKIYPAQRAGDPSEVANAAVFFASDDSRYCMGAELAVDGGLSTGHYYLGLPGAPEMHHRPNKKK